MCETAISGSFPKRKYPQTQIQSEVVINDYQLGELIKDSEVIGARRKKRFKIVE